MVQERSEQKFVEWYCEKSLNSKNYVMYPGKSLATLAPLINLQNLLNNLDPIPNLHSILHRLVRLRERPFPSCNIWWIDTILIRLRLGSNLHIQQLLSHAASFIMKCRDAVNRIHGKRVSISLVSNGQLERRVNVALLLIASDMDVELSRTLVGQAVDEPWVRVEVEDDGSVLRED